MYKIKQLRWGWPKRDLAMADYGPFTYFIQENENGLFLLTEKVDGYQTFADAYPTIDWAKREAQGLFEARVSEKFLEPVSKTLIPS